jgi:DNA repair exonuclease SbcCD ATPase subunit
LARKHLVAEEDAVQCRLATAHDIGRRIVEDACKAADADLSAVARDLATAQSGWAKFEAAQARIADIDRALYASPMVESAELGRMEQVVTAADTITRALIELEAAVDACATKLRTLRASVSSLLASRIEAPASALLSPAQLVEAKRQTAALAQLTADKAELETKLGVAEARLQQQTATIDSLKQQLASEKHAAAWSHMCSRARDIVHVSGLPKLMMHEYAARINKRIAHYMQIWESPFRFVLDDTLSFKAIFPDGTEMAAARLSGGQKIVASTSFRLAMSDTFARKVGLLVLDEPTNHLDKTNIVHLQQLLIKLKQLSGMSRRQMIVVTHEEQLMGFFDHTVKLAAVA